MSSGASFERKVESILLDSGMRFDHQVGIGGLRPDFLVYTSDGRTIVLEAKSWKKSPGFRNRAIQQARYYQEAIGADHAIVVVENLERSLLRDGVVTLYKLVEALNLLIEQQQVPTEKKLSEKVSDVSRSIFAAMPFKETYDDVYFVAMRYAAESVGAVCLRVDYEDFTGDIVDKIKSMITESIAVIADLSESRPNVLYETGFAHALNKKTVHICSTPLKDLPFDVSNDNTLTYQQGQTHTLREILAARLQAVIDTEA